MWRGSSMGSTMRYPDFNLITMMMNKGRLYGGSAAYPSGGGLGCGSGSSYGSENGNNDGSGYGMGYGNAYGLGDGHDLVSDEEFADGNTDRYGRGTS